MTAQPVAVALHSAKESKPVKPQSKCSYCDKTFKKLEHRQRHERVHTLDRPYTCASCGKTFARQDTLNRHARLHTRKEDGSSAPLSTKGRKRRPSVSANPSSNNNFNDEGGAALIHSISSSSTASTASSTSSIVSDSSLASNTASILSSSASSANTLLPFAYKGPVHPPSFPAYTRQVGNSLLQHSHSLPTTLSSHLNSDYHGFMDLSLGLGLQTAATAANTSSESTPNDPFAQLMSTFDNTPPKSSPSEDSDSDSGMDDDDDDEEDANTGSASTQPSPDSTSIELESFFDHHTNMNTSQLPSPAVTTYSPSDLHDQLALLPEPPTLSTGVDSFDLEAILANDPCHTLTSNHAALSSTVSPITVTGFSIPGGPAIAEENHNAGFDYESFAASVEGPTATSALSFEDLLFQATAPPTSIPAITPAVTTNTLDLLSKTYPTPAPRHTALHTKPQPHLETFSYASFLEERQKAEARLALHNALVGGPLPTPGNLVPPQSMAADSKLKSGHRASISMPSMTMPSMSASAPSVSIAAAQSSTLSPTFSSLGLSGSPPSAPGTSAAAAQAFHQTFAATFPSLGLMPNGLGLHPTDATNSLLADAYNRRKNSNSIAALTAGAGALNRLPTPPSTAQPAQPAFYIPSSSSSSSASVSTSTMVGENTQARLQVAVPAWGRLGLASDGVEAREPGASLFA